MPKLSRRALLSLAASGPVWARRDLAVRRAFQFLEASQSEDGGWHSTTYGLLRPGASLTPFVLNALLDAGLRDGALVDRAATFIARSIDMDGCVGRTAAGVPDYPNYATALAATARLRLGEPAGALVSHLRSTQLGAAGGWTPEDAAYGGWGMGGEIRRPPHPGHVDLSMTRVVIEALHRAGVGAADPAIVQARQFLARCQNPDGGFIFSPVIPGANKGGEQNRRHRSYATATADGVLALRACGIAESDPALVSAVSWLRANTLALPPERSRFQAGLRFYHAAVRALALNEAGDPGIPQQEDGGWRNPEVVVKEDDPFIATSLALQAFHPMGAGGASGA